MTVAYSTEIILKQHFGQHSCIDSTRGIMARYDIHGGSKNIFVRLKTSSNIDQFSNFFTIKIRRKYVIVPSLKIPLHLKCVATISCEMPVS